MLRAAILLALQFLCVQLSHADKSGGPQFTEELSKQAAIYHSHGEDVPQGYVIGRSLMSYAYFLPAEFTSSLADLGPEDRWLDIGAGEGQAILDYCTSRYEAMYMQGREPSGKARAVAMSIEDRRTTRWHRTAASLETDQIRYLYGKGLREYSLEELGRFQVITDVLGGFSYAQHLAPFMERALGLLELNGSFYTLLQDVHWENGANRPYYPDAAFLTEIKQPDGSDVKVCSWLKSIGCVEVTCEVKPKFQPPVEIYRIRKICEKVTVPALVPVHFEAGTPPERRFQLKAPLPNPAAASR